MYRKDHPEGFRYPLPLAFPLRRTGHGGSRLLIGPSQCRGVSRRGMSGLYRHSIRDAHQPAALRATNLVLGECHHPIAHTLRELFGKVAVQRSLPAPQARGLISFSYFIWSAKGPSTTGPYAHFGHAHYGHTSGEQAALQDPVRQTPDPRPGDLWNVVDLLLPKLGMCRRCVPFTIRRTQVPDVSHGVMLRAARHPSAGKRVSPRQRLAHFEERSARKTRLERRAYFARWLRASAFSQIRAA